MPPPLKFRNAQGDLVNVPEVPATRFKNEFAAMFEQAALGGAVAITKHDTPKAVLISYDEFQTLMRSRSAGLGELEARFDALLERMQTPKAKSAMAAAFEAPPGKVGRAAAKAVAAKRVRRKAG